MHCIRWLNLTTLCNTFCLFKTFLYQRYCSCPGICIPYFVKAFFIITTLYMKKIIPVCAAMLLTVSFAHAQENGQAGIAQTVTQPEVEQHIRFLASDELQGRDTGSPELRIAARYIAEYFRQHGIKPVNGMENYFQDVPLQKNTAPKSGTIGLGENSYNLKDDFLLISGDNAQLSGSIAYLNYGGEEDIAKADVQGKIVVVRAGKPGDSSPQSWFYSSREKRKALTEKGAAAIIELYNNPQLPWRILANYLGGDQIQLGEEEITPDEAAAIPHIWLQDADNSKVKELARAKKLKGTISIEGKQDRRFHSQNVLGMIEGTDPELKNEYVLLSAHYDHVGVKTGSTEADTIFNGARDNAVGTAAIMLAGKYFAENPPKRSVIIAAWTAEEKGLLGSSWYSEHPAVPLNQTIYNLNIDGAGYNDTTRVTVIGLERTTAEEDLKAAADAFNLEAIQDPASEQNLFDRSDNVNFAKKGVPAPTFSPGFTAFDEEIMRYYHQVEDNPETLNFSYLTQYSRAFTLAAKKIANGEQAPRWREGDKYEAAGKSLYQQ